MPPQYPIPSSRSATPDDDIVDDIPASIPATLTQADDEAEEQLEQELVETTKKDPTKKGKGSKRNQKVKVAEPKKPVNGDADEEEGEEEEDEYIVEAIIQHEFKGKKCLYRVRWEGWSENDDTWEPEEHLLPAAAALLASYHKKIGGVPQPTKQVRKSTSKANLKDESATAEDDKSPAAKRAKRAHRDTSSVIGPGSKEWEAQPLGGWLPSDKSSWEDLVHDVETVERDEENNLYAYIRFRNGKRSKVANNLYTSRCPRAMVRFYENHLSV